MKNSQLATLLSRSPLNQEDIHNITVIFYALSDERKLYILENWDVYMSRFVAEKNNLDKQKEKELLELLGRANTLLDAHITRMETKKLQQKEKEALVREELSSALQYDEVQKMRNIRSACKKI